MAGKEIETKTITNFGGRLTRILNGDLDSGFAKFTPSFGYDPFSKPLNLTWLPQADDITGPIGGQPVDIATRLLVGTQTDAYVLASDTKLYRIQTNSSASPNVDSVIGISSVAANGASYNFGGSLNFFGSVVGGVSAADPYMYITHDEGVNRIRSDGSAESAVSNNAFVVGGQFHPSRAFIGKLMIGNGNTVFAIDSTGTITSSVIGTGINAGIYSELNPPMGVDERVQDLDLSIDAQYLQITTSNVPTERLDVAEQDLKDASASDSAINKWNGADQTTTAITTIPTYQTTALQTWLGNSMFFSNDALGASVSDGTRKLLTLTNNKSALPNATGVNGPFLHWACPESSTDNTKRYMSLYYYGALDSENPLGLYRLLRWTCTQANGMVMQVPTNLLVNAKYQGIGGGGTLSIINMGYGKHYIGLTSVDPNGNYQNFLLRFIVTPIATSTPQLGVYETQTQLFSKRIGLSQIRVYTEPVATGNGFKIDIIATDGTIFDNGTFTYTFGDPVDKNTRINFNPDMQSMYGFGIRITNTGTTNMTIKKIEIDYTQEGK